MNKKREVACLLPYRRSARGLEFFLQQRDPTVPHINVGLLDLFGGGIEPGEKKEETLVRELYEELEYKPVKPVYFSRYENAVGIMHLFIEEVGDSFEKNLQVHEGLHGTFLTLEEAERLKIFAQTLLAVQQLTRALNN